MLRYLRAMCALGLLILILPVQPAVTPVSAASFNIIVPATQPWTDTGIDVTGGDALNITASGVIRIAGSDPGKTPAGAAGCIAGSTFMAPGLTCWSLIGRIGDGTPFQVGAALDLVVASPGRLYLGVNDETPFFGDNAGFWTAAIEVTPAPVQPVIDYFALGDSIASGHGLNDSGGPCRRSTVAYPAVVRNELMKRYRQVHFHHLACTGASAGQPSPDTLAQDPYKWLHNQVDTVLSEAAVLPADRPLLVSITIGANDFDWANPKNFEQRLYWDKDEQYQKWLDKVVERVINALTPELERLLAQPNIAVAVTEIYNPFNRESVFFKYNPIGDRCGLLGRTCYERTTRAVHQMNSAMVQMWLDLGQPDRLQITAISSAFEGHEAPRTSCGSAAPELTETWIQHKDDSTSNSFPDIPKKIAPGVWRGDCFHPNIFGAQHIASEVNADAIRMNR